MSFHTLIDAGDLTRLIAQKAVLVFDCRFDLADVMAGHAGYLTGHIPGALYLDLDRDLSSTSNGHNGRHPLPDRETFAARMAERGLDPGMQVVSYDISGGFYASRLWWLLRWAGHNDVAVLDGGLAAWTDAGFPLATGEQKAIPPGSFVAGPQTLPTVSATEVQANIAAGDRLVIDARSAERYRGEPHPLDPVAGHVPGAANRFFQRNLTPKGRFKPPAELARDFADVLGNTLADRAVHQCGSGVTATHNLLAMEIAGMTGSALYPGSWSEWISDPTRPIALGPR